MDVNRSGCASVVRAKKPTEVQQNREGCSYSKISKATGQTLEDGETKSSNRSLLTFLKSLTWPIRPSCLFPGGADPKRRRQAKR